MQMSQGQAPETIDQAGPRRSPCGARPLPQGYHPRNLLLLLLLWLQHHHGHQSGARSWPGHLGALWAPRQSSGIYVCFGSPGQWVLSTHCASWHMATCAHATTKHISAIHTHVPLSRQTSLTKQKHKDKVIKNYKTVAAEH